MRSERTLSRHKIGMALRCCSRDKKFSDSSHTGRLDGLWPLNDEGTARSAVPSIVQMPDLSDPRRTR